MLVVTRKYFCECRRRHHRLRTGMMLLSPGTQCFCKSKCKEKRKTKDTIFLASRPFINIITCQASYCSVGVSYAFNLFFLFSFSGE